MALSAKMLKSTAASIAPAVTAIFTLPLIQGRLPIEWRVAHVIPIPTSEQLPSPTNYRPVPLLSIARKSMCNSSTWQFSGLPLSLLNNGAFLKKSTTGALYTISNICMAYGSWSRKGCLLCNLTKAFDKVPHLPLLQTLAEFGYDYDYQRSQFVVVNGERWKCPNCHLLSTSRICASLHHLLGWNNTTSTSWWISFIALCWWHFTVSQNTSSSGLSTSATGYCYSGSMTTMNATKCKYMVLLRKHHPISPTHHLAICGTPIESVFELKYLGESLLFILEISYTTDI